MKREMDAQQANKTWVITDLSSHKRAVGSKWVFRIKYKSDGTIERYKARLVAKGFAQEEGLDYTETFAPVIKMTTVRIILALAASKDWPLFQLDVDNAFLHGSLDEEVYMEIPPGFHSELKKQGKVCKLLKSVYGLKQASRQLFSKFSDALLAYGFIQSLNDYSLFTFCKNGVFLVLLVYVDDVIITGTSLKAIDEVKEYIHSCFKIKDLGPLRFFVGLEVARSKTGIFINQRKYALELLEEAGLLGCKPATMPMDSKHSVSTSTSALLDDPTSYRRLVGKLIYLNVTRPDLSYSVHVLSQFMGSPRHDHLQAALRVLRYIKAAPAQSIFFQAKSPLHLETFCDADWASCPLTR
ncbi:unnamed protein product [Rhodiola kirilowii]